MEDSSTHHQHVHHTHHDRLSPPSPIDEEYPPTPSPRTTASPVSSPWIRKAGGADVSHDRRGSTQPHPDQMPPEHYMQQQQRAPTAPRGLSQGGMMTNDLEAGPSGATAAEQKKAKRKMICGCSKSTFIIVLFFLLVLVAAAIGGGVGGSIFANKKFVLSSSF